MKLKLKLIFSAVLIAGIISVSAATANSGMTGTNAEDQMKALFGDPAVAKGKGFEIKRSELDQIVTGARANAAAQGRELPPGFDMSVLNQMITIQLLLQQATPADRILGEAEANTEYTNLVNHFGSTDAFERQLKAAGMTLADLRAKAVQEATAKAALQRELHVTATDEDARNYYKLHSADFEVPEQVHVEHILLLTIDPATRIALSTNTAAAKRKQIEAIRKRAVAGEDFATLAKQYSEDTSSKENGGELPLFSRGENIPPEFEAAAFSMTNNQVSDIITTAFGFDIIKLLDKKPAKTEPFAGPGTKVVLSTGQTATIHDILIAQQLQKSAPDYVKQLRASADVQILDPSLKSINDAMEAAATNSPEMNSGAPMQ
jgi:parvulin-like peptidyl-prolyl isomerase